MTDKTNNLTIRTSGGARFLDCDVRRGYAKVSDHFFDSYDRETEHVFKHDSSTVGRMCVEVHQGMSVERFTLSPENARKLAANLLRMAEILEGEAMHPDQLPEGTVVLYGGEPHKLVKQENYHNKVSGFDEQRQHVRPVDGGETTITVLALDPRYGGVQK